jgi:hypothetical protein
MSTIRAFLKWSHSSIIGHVLFFEAAFALPLFLIFLYRSWANTTLCSFLRLLVVALILGAMLGAYVWYSRKSPRNVT